MFLSVSPKILNWESLSKNLEIFNFSITRFHWKIYFFRGEGVHELKWGLDSLQI